MHVLRVSETKLTPGNAFVVDLFPLGGEKESKYDERTLFCGSPQCLNLFLTFHLGKMQCVFEDYFSFSYFWPFPITFRN